MGTVPCPVHQGKRGLEAPTVDGDAPGFREHNLGEASEDVAGRHLDEQAHSELEEHGRGVVPANRAFDASSKVVADRLGVAQRPPADVAGVRDIGGGVGKRC